MKSASFTAHLRGEMVSSKNELIIANILYDLEKQGHLKYQVEPRLPFDDGRGRWADFLIEAKGRAGIGSIAEGWTTNLPPPLGAKTQALCGTRLCDVFQQEPGRASYRY